MTSKEFIIERLNNFAEEYNGIRIRYEFRESTHSHIIEICPSEIFESHKQYMVAEAEMESEFEYLFPEDEIYFITSGSLLEIRQVTYTRGHNTTSLISGTQPPEMIFEGYTDIILCRKVNYAIAA